MPVKVNKSNNPWKSPSGYLPLMKHNDVTETKVTNIFNYIRTQNWGSDFNLSTKESADVVAFSAMLEKDLLPAVLHVIWVDTDTYVNMTRPWYTSSTPLPLKFMLPSRYRKQAENRIFLAKGTDNISEEDVEKKIYSDAKQCLTYLSQKLEDKDYFFGKCPSSLDALVFGYVAPLLKAPMYGDKLTTHLRSFCENLCLHTSRILREFFPLSQAELEAKQKEEQKRKEKEAEDVEFPNKRRNMILAGVFAAAVMVSYAFVSGLVQIEVVDDEGPVS